MSTTETSASNNGRPLKANGEIQARPDRTIKITVEGEEKKNIILKEADPPSKGAEGYDL